MHIRLTGGWELVIIQKMSLGIESIGNQPLSSRSWLGEFIDKKSLRIGRQVYPWSCAEMFFHGGVRRKGSE
jgi:hypothetical protein